MASTIWKGSPQEGYRLQVVLDHNCTCLRNQAGAIVRGCPVHVAMTVDQRFLDGLLCMRRLHERLEHEEFYPDDPAR